MRSIAPFGVFIDLGGIDGLVHKSELSWNKVNNPESGYKVGEEVEAEVIDINHERGRISLSIRRLQPDPWHSTVADFNVGDVIDGTVTKLVNFGAFVRVRDGLEGLIHISELSHQRVAHPGDVVHEGQALKLKIISLDSERHRLGLSLKQAEEAPARPAPEPGTPVRRPAGPAGPRPERRPRPERGYSMSDAVQEPEGGIDNTLASAFAQVREQLAAAEGDDVPSRPTRDDAERAEPPSAEAVAETAPPRPSRRTARPTRPRRAETPRQSPKPSSRRAEASRGRAEARGRRRAPRRAGRPRAAAEPKPTPRRGRATDAPSGAKQPPSIEAVADDGAPKRRGRRPPRRPRRAERKRTTGAAAAETEPKHPAAEAEAADERAGRGRADEPATRQPADDKAA